MSPDHQPSPRDNAKLFQRIELSTSAEQRAAVYHSVVNSSHVGIEYVVLLILAGLIALFGLRENSAAVIIGAMLISPLMSPILSAGLALLLGDGKLGKRSAVVLALSISGVIGVAWLVAYLIPLKQVTPVSVAPTQGAGDTKALDDCLSSRPALGNDVGDVGSGRDYLGSIAR